MPFKTFYKNRKDTYSYNRGKKCIYCDSNARVKGLCINCYQKLKRYEKRGIKNETI